MEIDEMYKIIDTCTDDFFEKIKQQIDLNFELIMCKMEKIEKHYKKIMETLTKLEVYKITKLDVYKNT